MFRCAPQGRGKVDRRRVAVKKSRIPSVTMPYLGTTTTLRSDKIITASGSLTLPLPSPLPWNIEKRLRHQGRGMMLAPRRTSLFCRSSNKISLTADTWDDPVSPLLAEDDNSKLNSCLVCDPLTKTVSPRIQRHAPFLALQHHTQLNTKNDIPVKPTPRYQLSSSPSNAL